jgi:hypothetical protein
MSYWEDLSRMYERPDDRTFLENDIKLAQIRAAVQRWLDKQGHERCWYYPEIFQEIVDILGIKPTVQPNLPPECEFKEGCERYRGEEYAAKVETQGRSPLL